MAEKEHEDLTCSVCLEELKDPKVLPCCHTFCRGCLERILKKSGQKETLICPQCRAEHGVPVGGTDAFLTDFTVLQTFRLRRFATKRKYCGMCSGPDTAPVSFCEECEEYLGEYCSGAHKRMKLFTDHNVVALSEFEPESFNPKPKPYYCQQHPQNVLQFFCQTCNQLICGNCVIRSRNRGDSVHNTHIVTTLSNSLKPMERELNELVRSADHNRKRYESDLKSLKRIEKQEEHYVQQLKEQVNTAVDLYVECLQVSRVRTLEEIDATSRQESKNSQTQKQHLRSAVSRINSGLKFSSKALQCHSDTERVAMIGQAMSQLKQPHKPHFRIKPPRVVKDLEGTLETLLQEFKSSDIHVSVVCPGRDTRPQLGKKSHLKVTIRVKPVGNPQFLIKYGASYCCSLTPQTKLESDNTWLLEFTPCCGGRHAVSACIYGVRISCDVYTLPHVSTFYVEGTLKEQDIVRRIPNQFGIPVKVKETTGKVTSVKQNLLGKGGSNCYTVHVKWIKGEEEWEESLQWGDPHGYPLELVL